MSTFTDDLVVSPLADGRKWELRCAFDYHVGSEDSPDVIHVPLGFVTDFASVPQIFWSILPPTGKYGKASVIHDYLYQSKIRSRMQADAIFHEAMLVLKVPKWKAGLMYWAVRCFGWLGYSKNNLPERE
jgi:hypothetical protein